MEEDAIVDKECERLDAQAREAQYRQEQATKARESLAKQVESRRRLKKVQNELEVAKYICELLKQESQDVTVSAPQSSLAVDPPSEVSTQQHRVAAAIDLKSSALVMPSHSAPCHSNFAPVSSVMPPPVLPAVHITASVAESPFRSVTSAAEVTQPTLRSRHDYAAPETFNPAAVARPYHYSDTSVTYSLTPAVSVPAIVPSAVPVTLGAPFQAQSFQITNPSPPWTAVPYPVPPHDTPHNQAVSYPSPAQPPGLEMLAASAYGVPKPAIPYFDTGRESDFALLKMALDNVMNNQPHLSEHYKYQVLLSHLKLLSAFQLAKAYMYDPGPYTTALQALQDKYGQPRQLVQSELGVILNAPAVRFGDAEAFDSFSLSIQTLVGMLRTLEGPNGYELCCGSHVDRLLSKMPPSYRDGFVEYCFGRGILQTGTDRTYTLPDLSAWLQMKSQAKCISNKAATMYQTDTTRATKKDQQKSVPPRPKERSTSILYSADASSVLRDQPESRWPTMPAKEPESEAELKRSAMCLQVCTSPDISLPDISQFSTWTELLKATVTSLHGAATSATQSIADSESHISAEKLLLQRAQKDSFPEEFKALSSERPLPSNSRLASLSPEYDRAIGLIRVGGRLRHAKHMELDAIHPIVLDPQHNLTKLLIKDCDSSLLHPGPERVFAELRRRYWILRGREAIKKHQYRCMDCQKWCANPGIPKMADLPPTRLRLYKPPFYSTGMDCFGPFTVKIGRRTEKRWGIVFKCLTTRCLHLDLLESLDTDAFLMSLRRFISRRGKPFELLSDNGTNFVGGNKEMQAAYDAMIPQLRDQLAEKQILFRFIPPGAPHFGGAWEREVKSVKQALKVVLKDQTVPETVLRTVLIEVEGILNAKPLGYVSSDVSDLDPVTPSILLMGRHDSSLPQVLYDSSNLLGTRRWKHSQVLADHLWSRFIHYYLPNLQERQKWRKDGGEIGQDQVVLIVDPQLPRACWPVGKVTNTFPGLDGRTRTVEVQVQNRTYVRPVSRLVPLPKLSDDDPVEPPN
ncbi:hypothetical protein QQF64_002845 [Cirrhinus molitorella]|uniref:Integrase catalytic domain-containing protein n=1 Tax=Cirrhinus molitorella TaxID=172907 RepID=A0ABR3MRC8_9TELE